MLDVDRRLRQRAEKRAPPCPGMSERKNAPQGDFLPRLRRVQLHHAAYNFLFHNFWILIYNKVCSTEASLPASAPNLRQHLDRDLFFHRQLDRAGLQYLGADGRQFQHFLIAYFIDLACAVDDARISRIDAVHIGIDIAARRALQRQLKQRPTADVSEPPRPSVAMRPSGAMP